MYYFKFISTHNINWQVHLTSRRHVDVFANWHYRTWKDRYEHKAFTSVKENPLSGVFQNIEPPPSSPSECVLPPHQSRGVKTRRAVRGVGGGSIFWKTPDIGLSSYSIISSSWQKGFYPSILRHSGIWGAVDETLLNIVQKIFKKCWWNKKIIAAL